MKTRNSQNYICTLDPKNANDMKRLAFIKESVHASNTRTAVECKYRVVIKGRKPIQKFPYTNRWTGKTSMIGYNWAGDILGGLKNAQAWDVYVYQRNR